MNWHAQPLLGDLQICAASQPDPAEPAGLSLLAHAQDTCVPSLILSWTEKQAADAAETCVGHAEAATPNLTLLAQAQDKAVPGLILSWTEK